MGWRLLEEEGDLETTLGEDMAGEENLCGCVEESVGPRWGERMATPT